MKKARPSDSKPCLKCGEWPRLRGNSYCRGCHNQVANDWYHREVARRKELQIEAILADPDHD